MPRVYINDQYWGLYTVVEGKDEMFKHRFDHRDADAIESLDFGNMCFLGTDPDLYNEDKTGFPYYVLENGNEGTAFPLFADMIDKANNTSSDNYMDVVPNYLNLEDFIKYQAANVYLLNFDSYLKFYGNQIYMFDTTNQIWQVIPWDFNASLGLWGDEAANNYPMIPPQISNGCIASKIKDVPELNLSYLDAMCELSQTICDTTAIFNRIDF